MLALPSDLSSATIVFDVMTALLRFSFAVRAEPISLRSAGLTHYTSLMQPASTVLAQAGNA
jgi:hypothetical protein